MIGPARKAPKLPTIRGALDGIVRKIGASRAPAMRGTARGSEQVNYTAVKEVWKFEAERQRILREAYMRSLSRRF